MSTKAQPTPERFDVVIVGFGAAGASAAIEAAGHGARVLVIDRGTGGGATALSGGVVYAGGGTTQQHEAGFADSPDNMFNYLRHEVDGAVSDETLRRFCDGSPAMIDWLEQQGCEFPASLCPYKTSYPSDRHYLYFSGNEQAWPYPTYAEPAPRGHRQKGPGLGAGKALFDALKASALAKGVTFKPQSRAGELVVADGRVTGLRYRHAPAEAFPPGYDKAFFVASKLGNWAPAAAAPLQRWIDATWDRAAKDYEVTADAVILAAGGFAFNPTMLARHARGAYADIQPLGTVGDDGSGIALGVSAGGTVADLDHLTCWRFLTPVSAFLKGVAVGPSGRRVANEDLYGATFSKSLINEHDGKGWLVMDATVWREARGQVLSQSQPFHLIQLGWVFSPKGHRKADSLAELAAGIGVDAAGLVATVQAYNQGVLGDGDPFHKAPAYSRPLVDGPYYAFDISVQNVPVLPAAGLTLGGLQVDEGSGEVLSGSGPIDGLYAAGRTAKGICSHGYISGLSIADAVFSGRRAGAHAAGRKSA